MQRNWKEILGAFCMGVMVPGMILPLFSLQVPASREPTQSQESTQVPNPGIPTVQQPVYLPVLMDGGGVKVIELDTYLLGVLLGEMPASFEEEALKAQAVAARTFALLCYREGYKHSFGGVCADSSCCQAYMSAEDYLAEGGTVQNLEKVRGAVEVTTGQVITYQGELIQATYFSCSGGRTEDAVAVWGGEVPYLQSVDSPGEEMAQMFTHSVRFTPEEFAKKLNRKLQGNAAQWLGKVTRTRGGGVDTMVVAGKTYTGTQLRALLELNSTAFYMEAQGGDVVITTSGKGHRVGMSQYGAQAMAMGGSTYTEILQHYYPTTRIDKISSLQ